MPRPDPYRGRFAPSPTGPLHFGSLAAAAGSWLDARAHGGEWLLRMEDLDTPRIVPGAADDILRTLEALGLTWDGPVVYQSARHDAYRAALDALKQRQQAYACACSRKEIADSGVAGIEGFVYPGTCRDGLPAGRVARAWRLDTRGSGVIGFDDAIQGRVGHDVEHAIGDFVLYRADGHFAYQLAVVVDDAEQGITDVVRGADLIESTPRQLWLQRVLGLPAPRYAHLPVAVNAAGEKLSKQTLAPAIDAASGGRALAAALRFLGHAPPPELASAAPAELLA
ncbi:MAG: tRNA glutamyl-Q(34) synthetase GluQRS, partial [Burkholderiales bacterium]